MKNMVVWFEIFALVCVQKAEKKIKECGEMTPGTCKKRYKLSLFSQNKRHDSLVSWKNLAS